MQNVHVKMTRFHGNEYTGDMHLVLHKYFFCHRGKSQLGIGLFRVYSSMSWHREPLISLGVT